MLDLLAEHDGRTDDWFAGAATLLRRGSASRTRPASSLPSASSTSRPRSTGSPARLRRPPRRRPGRARCVSSTTRPAARPREHFEAKALFQMKFYALVLWRQRGVIPSALQLVYLGNSEIVAYEPDEQDLLGTERKVKALWQAIERAADDRRLAPQPEPALRLVRPPGLCPAWGGTPPPLPETPRARRRPDRHRGGRPRRRNEYLGAGHPDLRCRYGYGGALTGRDLRDRAQ